MCEDQPKDSIYRGHKEDYSCQRSWGPITALEIRFCVKYWLYIKQIKWLRSLFELNSCLAQNGRPTHYLYHEGHERPVEHPTDTLKNAESWKRRGCTPAFGCRWETLIGCSASLGRAPSIARFCLHQRGVDNCSWIVRAWNFGLWTFFLQKASRWMILFSTFG